MKAKLAGKPWNIAVEPYVRFAGKNKGYWTKVRDMHRKLDSEAPDNRVSYWNWFASDPSKRIEPRYSTGVLLLNACQRVMLETGPKNALPKGGAK